MQVVIVTGMIDVFLLVSHELEGKKTEKQHSRVHIQNIYARKRTYRRYDRGKPAVASAHRVSEHAERRRERGAVYLGHVAV